MIPGYIYIMHDRVYKKIQSGEELLVWYGEDYAAELGIIDTPDEEDKQQLQLISGMFSYLLVFLFKRNCLFVIFIIHQRISKFDNI